MWLEGMFAFLFYCNCKIYPCLENKVNKEKRNPSSSALNTFQMLNFSRVRIEIRKIENKTTWKKPGCCTNDGHFVAVCGKRFREGEKKKEKEREISKKMKMKLELKQYQNCSFLYQTFFTFWLSLLSSCYMPVPWKFIWIK